MISTLPTIRVIPFGIPMPVDFSLWGRLMEMRRLSGEAKGTGSFHRAGGEYRFLPGENGAVGYECAEIFAGSVSMDKSLILCTEALYNSVIPFALKLLE